MRQRTGCALVLAAGALAGCGGREAPPAPSVATPSKPATVTQVVTGSHAPPAPGNAVPGAQAQQAEDEAGVRATLMAFAEALRDRRSKDICGLLTDEARLDLVKSIDPESAPADCPRIVADGRRDITAGQVSSMLERARTVPITVNGANATSEALNDAAETTTFAYRDGRWLIADN